MSNIGQKEVHARQHVVAFFHGESSARHSGESRTRHSGECRNPVKQTGDAAPCRDIPDFCKAETIEDIGKHGLVLTPGRYVGADAQEDDGEPFADKYTRLLAELDACFAECRRLEATVRVNLTALEDVQ